MSLVMSPVSYTSPRLSPPPQLLSLNSPTFHDSPHASPSNASPAAERKGILIPTDRTIEELEEWLPKLGRLKVDREVVLKGYSLYALRTWYLSRTHWSQTIVTQTGKPAEQVSAFVLVPDPELSPRNGELELSTALQFLISETHAHQRQIEHGILLVNTPAAFGQDVFPIPGGDLREMKPYLVVNTDLRRLGCGGRAAMGMESPIPAVRRKLLELYRLPAPPSLPLSRHTSPTTSPIKVEGGSPTSPHPITSDPFAHMLVELVKLVQASLLLWGMLSSDIEIDGLFCDETKTGIFGWRKLMGMEHEESMRLEKETSGGCIDPKTLAALLGSVTSVRYQLDALDVEKVPKDPFSSPKRFLSAWHVWQTTQPDIREKADFLNVSTIRRLRSQYLSERSRYPDPLNIHRLFMSGVASATSSLSANLKGGTTEDTPLRKREHHHYRAKSDEGGDHSGMGLILPSSEVGPFAAPDVITLDLEAYTKGILKSREKDWDVMGARRIASLWSGQTELGRKASHRRLNTGLLRRRHGSVDVRDGQDLNGMHEDSTRGPLGKMTTKTGQAIKGGLGFVSRRTTTYETSDSDTGGPGPSSLKNALARRKQSTVPTVIEPDVEEVDEQLNHSFTPSPSPSASRLHVDRQFGTSASHRSHLSVYSHARPSIVTNLSMDGSDAQSRLSYRPASPLDTRGEHEPDPGNRAFAWRNRGRATAMLRTSSDGADVVLEEGGMEWEVVNPHGTGKGHGHDHDIPLVRRHSLQDRLTYKSVRVSPATHLAVDVEMCAIVMELRERERQLARKAQEAKILEDSVFKASQDIIDALRSRRSTLTSLETQSESLQRELRKLVDDVDIDEDSDLRRASRNITFFLSEDTHQNELNHWLNDLRKEWEDVRAKTKAQAEGVVETKSRGWRLWW